MELTFKVQTGKRAPARVQQFNKSLFSKPESVDMYFLDFVNNPKQDRETLSVETEYPKNLKASIQVNPSAPVLGLRKAAQIRMCCGHARLAITQHASAAYYQFSWHHHPEDSEYWGSNVLVEQSKNYLNIQELNEVLSRFLSEEKQGFLRLTIISRAGKKTELELASYSGSFLWKTKGKSTWSFNDSALCGMMNDVFDSILKA